MLPPGLRNGALAEVHDVRGVPMGIRTPVTAVKGRCPRPLDDGDLDFFLLTVYLSASAGGRSGGGNRDRTGDLLHAMQALSQLSYTPTQGCELYQGNRALSRSSTRFFPATASVGPRFGVCVRPNTTSRRGIASLGSLSLRSASTAFTSAMTAASFQSPIDANRFATSASAGLTSSVRCRASSSAGGDVSA